MLNKIVTALRNRMTWSNIKVHLIEADDIDPNSFDFELVARLWAATPRRGVQHKERKQRGSKKEVQDPIVVAKRKYKTPLLRIVKGRESGITWQDLNQKVLSALAVTVTVTAIVTVFGQ